MFAFCEIGNELSKKALKLSREKVSGWLNQYPRSPWWISNVQVADYCLIPQDGLTHNTTILGKYLPRRKCFWQRSPGLYCALKE